MIVSAFILLFGAAAMYEFSFALCRSLLLTYGKVELSSRVREVIGVSSEVLESREFDRVITLVRLAPDPGDDGMEITFVLLYYRFMNVLGWLVSPLSERVSNWFETELSRCSHFAAVTLDRRLAETSR